jgi:enoyl-CoA hydratase
MVQDACMLNLEINGAIATVLMSRPPVNAINGAFVADFNAALSEIEGTKPTLVILRSDQKSFCAGADLAQVSEYLSAADGTCRLIEYVQSLHALFNRIEALSAVTLAVIEGPALGGGVELALACDLRVASMKAKIGLPEARIGMIPGAGGTQLLPRLCGPGVASRLILGGEMIDGTEARRLGVVQWAEDPASVGDRVDEIKTRVAGLSRQALAASKECIAAWSDPGKDGFALEIEVPRKLLKTEDARKRIKAFLEGVR